MTAPELKPCPFCGAVDPEWLASHVVCDCGATGPRQDVDREYQADAMRALTDWNRRADIAAVQPAQVQVKPLVWGWNEGLRGWRADCQLTRDVFCVYETNTGWVASSETTGSTIHANADAAKYALDGNRAARILAALEPLPDQTVEIDLRVAMMEELEKAASESLWVPEEYYMNEVISDCCAFLRSDRSQPDPRDEVIARMVEALEWQRDQPEAHPFMKLQADAALAAAKAVQHC